MFIRRRRASGTISSTQMRPPSTICIPLPALSDSRTRVSIDPKESTLRKRVRTAEKSAANGIRLVVPSERFQTHPLAEICGKTIMVYRLEGIEGKAKP